MASNINANNIDGNYPVAGQDNDSQGFRDNFTNTRTNFQFAANEISDLQQKAVLKQALDGTILNNDMGGSLLLNARLQDISQSVISNLPAAGTVTIDYALGPYYAIPSTNGSVTLSFTNLSGAGTLSTFQVQITISNIAHTLTLPAAVGAGGALTSAQNILGLNVSTNVITFNATGTYVFEFRTTDSGSSVYIQDLVRPAKNFLGSDTFAANGAVSLNTSTTVITSSSNLVGTLAAGTEGQTKIVAYGNTSSGNTLITVTNAAWGGANLANLSVVGSAATFQYVGNKWFCVGNNSVTFS
jgi:hypothetical protein